MADQTKQGICVARHLDHVAIAVSDIHATLKLYGDLFGVDGALVEDVPDQGVKAVLLKVGRTQLEFIPPTDSNGGVARFIERRGEGLHHICFEVDGLQQKLDALDSEGVALIDKAPREGLAGMIAFIHPRSTGGVLVELVDSDTTGR